MGWQPHEVNLRLGHTPNAKTLNAYINHLAIDRHRSKRKLYDSQIQALQEELREARERERLTRHARVPQDGGEGERIRNENNLLRTELVQTKTRVEEIAEMVRTTLSKQVG